VIAIASCLFAEGKADLKAKLLGIDPRIRLPRVRSVASGRSFWPGLLHLSDAIQQASCESVFLAGIEAAASDDATGQRA